MNSLKKNILIVDDNFDMLDLLQRHIKILNYHTYKASSVSEAIEVLRYNTIDLLITDIQMPEVNGIELLKYTEEHFPELPKLVITGMPSVDNAVNALQSGALGYLIKPFTTEELSTSIKSSLSKSINTKSNSETLLTEQNHFYSSLCV